jgi:tetratricopeptide (TPR) repeat protein
MKIITHTLFIYLLFYVNLFAASNELSLSFEMMKGSAEYKDIMFKKKREYSKKGLKCYILRKKTTYYLRCNDATNSKEYKESMQLLDSLKLKYKVVSIKKRKRKPIYSLGDGYKAYNSKKYKKAKKIFLQNYKYKRDSENSFAMALIELHYKNFTKAYRYLEPYRKRDKKAKKLYYDIIVTQYYDLINGKRYKKAFRLQDRWIKTYPKLRELVRPDLDPTLKDGYDAFNAQKYERAYRIFKLNYNKKKNFDTAYALSLVYMKKNRYKKVRELLKDYKDSNKKADGLYYDSILSSYNWYETHNKPLKALAILKEYKLEYPQLADMQDLLLKEADKLIEVDKFDEAKKLLDDNDYKDSDKYIFNKKYKKALALNANNKEFDAIRLIVPYVATYSKASTLYRDITFKFVGKHLQNREYQRAKELLKPLAPSSKKAKKLYFKALYSEKLDSGWRNFNNNDKLLALSNFEEACNISYEPSCLEGMMSASYKLKDYNRSLELAQVVYLSTASQEAAFIGFYSALKLEKYKESDRWYKLLASKKEALLRLPVNKGMNESIRVKYVKEVKRNPNDFELVVNYLDFLKAAKYYEQFEFEVDKALKMFFSPIEVHILKMTKREYQNGRFFQYYQNGQNEECFVYGNKIIQEKDDIDFKRIHGWCAFKSKHYTEAEKIFDKINKKYGETKDDLYAQYLSASNANNYDKADTLLNKLYILSSTDKENIEITSAYIGIDRLKKAQKLTFNIVDKEKKREMQKRINATYKYGTNKVDSFSIGVHYKKRSIEDGYHNFSEYFIPIDFDFYDKSLRHYYIDADIIHLYDVFEGSQSLHSMEYGYGYVYSDDKTFTQTVASLKAGIDMKYMSIELSSTPIGATVTPAPLGKIELHSANPKWNIFAKYSISELEDSMLSFIGNSDKNLNKDEQIDWGRVTKSAFEVGVSLNTDLLFYSLSGLYADQIDGDYTLVNKEKKVTGMLLYRVPTIKFAYLDYSLLGIYDEYDANSDLLTYGHGGYFSPQKFILLNTSVELADNFNSRFYYKTKISLGYEKFRVDNSKKFPIYDNVSKNLTNGIVSGYTADGVIFKTALGLGYKIDKKFNILGVVSYEQMKEFNTIEAGVFLNYSFKPKHKVNLYHFHDSHRADMTLR